MIASFSELPPILRVLTVVFAGLWMAVAVGALASFFHAFIEDTLGRIELKFSPRLWRAKRAWRSRQKDKIRAWLDSQERL